MRITHAPSGNFVIDTIRSTTNDRKQPIPWITMLLRQPGCRWVRWCFTMPACESVKPVNTPMA